MKEREPIELTIKPVNPTLEVKGDIFMPEPGNGEIQPKEPTEIKPQEPAVTMGDSLEKRQEFIRTRFDKENQGRTVPFEEKQTQRLITELGILPMLGGSGDEPEDQGGKPNEEQPPLEPTPEEQGVGQEPTGQTTESEDDPYSIISDLTRSPDYEAAKRAIDESGEDLIRHYMQDLPREYSEKHLEELKKLKGLSAEETRERFSDIVRNIQDEALKMRLDEPSIGQTSPEQSESSPQDAETQPQTVSEGAEDNGGEGGEPPEGPPPVEPAPEEPEEPGGEQSQSERENAGDGEGNKTAEQKRREEWQVHFAAMEPLEKQIVERLFPDEEDLVHEVFRDAKKVLIQRMIDTPEARPISVPESLEEYTKLIMNSAAPEWRKGKEKSLIKEDGSVNTVNFLDWSRENVLNVHNNNPVDPVNFFSDIGTSVRTELYAGTIGFYEITFGKNFFLKDEINEKGEHIKVKNEEYDALHDQILYETFLLMLLRNPDIAYTQHRGGEKEMFGVLSEAFLKNPLTRSNFLEFIFTMPSVHKKSISEIKPGNEEKELMAKREGNFFVGDAAREALATYIDIFDYNQLVEILGKDCALLTKDKDENGNIVLDDKDGRKMEWFNKDGSTKLFKRNLLTRKWDESTDETGSAHPDFMKHINIFLNPNILQESVTEVRQLIRRSIKERNGISDKEAELAELFAYTMTHTSGVAAKGDVESVAFDWLTRLTNFRDKRKREKREKTGGKYGSRFNLEGFKRLGLTFLEAARDKQGRSIQSIIQGGTGGKIDIKGNPLKDRLDYERDQSKNIIFRRGGIIAPEIVAKDYEIYDEEIILENGETQTKPSVRFLDASGKVVEVGDATPTEEIIKAELVRFGTDLQRQFVPVHLQTAAGVYEWIMEDVQLRLPEMHLGFDSYGNAILDQKKMDEVKDGIIHHLRYYLSTWAEINYDEENLEYERLEVRNDRGKLIAKKKAQDDSDLELDEDWYVLDRKGRKTEERNEPETYLNSRVMTRLENMFGVDALKYIQFEIEKRGLATKQEGKVKTITDERGNRVEVDFSNAKEEEFRTAVWHGAFDYIIKTEIEAHRTRGSGYRRWNSGEINKSEDVLIIGEMRTPDQVKKIREDTKTTARYIYSQDFGYAFALGGFEGGWKVFQIMLKEILSGK